MSRWAIDPPDDDRYEDKPLDPADDIRDNLLAVPSRADVPAGRAVADEDGRSALSRSGEASAAFDPPLCLYCNAPVPDGELGGLLEGYCSVVCEISAQGWAV